MEILDLLGNPEEADTWKRRGLVMGDVQSGKTATYSALICKAADAGYGFIVLLTGTIENLRRQTQERLDAGFVGFDSSEQLKRNARNLRVGVGLLDGRRQATVFTSSSTDFRVATLDALRTHHPAWRLLRSDHAPRQTDHNLPSHHRARGAPTTPALANSL